MICHGGGVGGGGEEGRSRSAVACWTYDHWVAGSNQLRGMSHH